MILSVIALALGQLASESDYDPGADFLAVARLTYDIEHKTLAEVQAQFANTSVVNSLKIDIDRTRAGRLPKPDPSSVPEFYRTLHACKMKSIDFSDQHELARTTMISEGWKCPGDAAFTSTFIVKDGKVLYAGWAKIPPISITIPVVVPNGGRN